MPQKELDLLQLTSRGMAEPSTRPTQIMWRQFRDPNGRGGLLHDVPNRFFRDPSPHALPTLFTLRNSFPLNRGCYEPVV